MAQSIYIPNDKNTQGTEIQYCTSTTIITMIQVYNVVSIPEFICIHYNSVSIPHFATIAILHYIGYCLFPLSNHSIDKNQILTANNV